jgi:aspartate aminotransferase
VLGTLAAERLRAVGLRVEEPVGGFYLFPDFSPHRGRLASRAIASDVDLCERILVETGVAILPGSAFGRDPSELTARLAYVDFDGAKALAAAETLGPGVAIEAAFVEQYCARTLTGVERLCKWLA